MKITYLSSVLISLTLICCEKGDNGTEDDLTSPKACFEFQKVADFNVDVSFNADCSENAVSYSWDFGDGNYSQEKNPVHRFTRSGTFNVELTVLGSDNTSNQISDTIQIAEEELFYHFGAISNDEVWSSGVHIILGSVYVTNATLTIMPGVIVKFNEGQSLMIGGEANDPAALVANGTVDSPIIFMANSLDPAKGFWENISFKSGTTLESSLRYCEFESGGSETGVIDIGNAPVSVTFCTIHNSANYGITIFAGGGDLLINNNTITGCDNSPVSSIPNAIHLIGENNNYDPDSDIAVSYGNLTIPIATWKKLSVPYRLESSLTIGSENGSILNLEPGVEIRINNHNNIFAGTSEANQGSINAVGTETQPIVFTSAEDVPNSEDWNGISIVSSIKNPSAFKYCIFEYGGFAGMKGASEPKGTLDIRNCGVTIENCIIRNYSTPAVVLNATGYFTSFRDNSLDAPEKDGIVIHPNWVHTIADNNLFNVKRGVVIYGGNMSQASVTWKKLSCAYILSGDIEVGSPTGSTLTIAPGTTLKINGGHLINIGGGYAGPGALIADGESETILFTRGTNDLQTGPGIWNYIWLGNKTLPGTIINKCILEYGGGNDWYGAIHISYNDNPVITNNVIRFSDSFGISRQGCDPVISGNVFTDNKGEDFDVTY